MSEYTERGTHKTIKRQRIESGDDIIVTTETEHTCNDCGETIPVGSKTRYTEKERDYQNKKFEGLYQHEPPCMTPREIIQRAFEDAKK